MCGRFVSARQRQELIDEFLVERDRVPRDVAPDYNVAPTDPIYAVMTRASRENGAAGHRGAAPAAAAREAPARELRLVRWGLVPSWAKDRSAGARLINARAETVAVGWVHDRMPMVVSPGHWDEWLGPATGDAESLLRAITPAASDDLETRPVSTAVNSVAHDGPDLITPLAAEGGPGTIPLAAEGGPGEA